MATQIQVSPESLKALADKIETAAGEYKTLYSTTLLNDNIGEVQSAWQGKDSDAFVNQINGFKDDFDKMDGILNDYASYLRAAAAAYESSINALADGVTALQN